MNDSLRESDDDFFSLFDDDTDDFDVNFDASPSENHDFDIDFDAAPNYSHDIEARLFSMSDVTLAKNILRTTRRDPP